MKEKLINKTKISIACLQIEQSILELLAWLLVKTLTNQECQLMCILTWSWHTHCPWPVVVQMGQLIGQPLQVTWLQPRVVLDDIVGGWIHSSLSDGLRYKEEVVSLRKSYYIINHSSTWRVNSIPAFHLHDPGVDLLVDHDVGKLDLVFWETSLGKTGENSSNLMINYVLDLSISNAISINDNSARKVAI